MSLEQITITVDEQWVLNLVEKLQKYEMFKDQRQKIVEAILAVDADEQDAKKDAVTQNMVELWCIGHGVKMVRREDLVQPFEGAECPNKSLATCPGIWIKPFENLEDNGVSLGTCSSHTQCTKCWKCIDGAGWIFPSSGNAICTDCRSKSKIGSTAVPKQYSLANVNRPKLGTVRKATIPNGEDTSATPVKKKIPAKKTVAKKTLIAGAQAAKPKPVVTKKAPVKPGSWVEFAAKRRGELKVSQPDLSHSELTKIISAEWKIVKSNI